MQPKEVARAAAVETISHLVRTVPGKFGEIFVDEEASEHNAVNFVLPVATANEHADLALHLADFLRACFHEPPKTDAVLSPFGAFPPGRKTMLDPVLQWFHEMEPEIQLIHSAVLDGVWILDGVKIRPKVWGKPDAIPLVQKGMSFILVVYDAGNEDLIETSLLGLFDKGARVGKVIAMGDKYDSAKETEALVAAPVEVVFKKKEFFEMRAYYDSIGMLPDAEHLPGDDEERRGAWV